MQHSQADDRRRNRSKKNNWRENQTRSQDPVYQSTNYQQFRSHQPYSQNHLMNYASYNNYFQDAPSGYWSQPYGYSFSTGPYDYNGTFPGPNFPAPPGNINSPHNNYGLNSYESNIQRRDPRLNHSQDATESASNYRRFQNIRSSVNDQRLNNDYCDINESIGNFRQSVEIKNLNFGDSDAKGSKRKSRWSKSRRRNRSKGGANSRNSSLDAFINLDSSNENDDDNDIINERFQSYERENVFDNEPNATSIDWNTGMQRNCRGSPKNWKDFKMDASRQSTINNYSTAEESNKKFDDSNKTQNDASKETSITEKLLKISNTEFLDPNAKTETKSCKKKPSRNRRGRRSKRDNNKDYDSDCYLVPDTKSCATNQSLLNDKYLNKNVNNITNFERQQEQGEPKSVIQKLLEISNNWDPNTKITTDTNNYNKGQESDYSIESIFDSDDDANDRSETSSKSNKQTTKQQSGQHMKLTSALTVLSPEFFKTYLNKILDFLLDDNMLSISFKEVTNDVEANFLMNIKSSKKILNSLNPECSVIYRKIMMLYLQSKITFMVRYKRVRGIKVLEYTKTSPKMKSLRDAQRKPVVIDSATEEFMMKTLERTLEFFQDDAQASLEFNNITDRSHVSFILSLKRLNANKKMSEKCWIVYKQIIKLVRSRSSDYSWGLTCKNLKERRFIVYHKLPPKGDVNSVKSDSSDGKRSRMRMRKRSRGRNRDVSKETVESEDRSKKDNMISFLPQKEKDEDIALAPPQVKEVQKDAAPQQRVTKEKAKILEGLAKPVVASKAERMMMMMGWKGGALGSKGDGIVEPLAPNLLQIGQAGLGHVNERIERGMRQRRRPKDDDFEIGVWDPVSPVAIPGIILNPIPMQLAPKSRLAPMNKHTSRRARKKMAKEAAKCAPRAQACWAKDSFKLAALKKLLEFVMDDRQLEMSFDKSLKGIKRKMVHEIVACLAEGTDPSLDNPEQMKLYTNIVNKMDCVLYTESKGENREGTRQLFVYKTVADDTFLITPDELEEEEDEPLNPEETDDCVIVEPEDNDLKESEKQESAADIDEDNENKSKHDSEDEIEPVTFSYNKAENSNEMLRVVGEGGNITGISIFRLKFMPVQTIHECPKDSICEKFQLCRKFRITEIVDDSSSVESVEIPKRLRKRPYSKTNTKGVDLIETRMKSIKIPRQETEQSDAERITRLLVACLEEFFDDKEALKLRFLGDFKVIDRIVINSFMNELSECANESTPERLFNIYGRDPEIYETLKRILYDSFETIQIHRNDDGPFSTYTAIKVIPIPDD